MPKDPLSRAAEEFATIFAQINELKSDAQWPKVAEIVGKNLKRLLGTDYGEFVKLTELGMLAKLVKNGPCAWVPYKMAILTALLKEAGDYATAKFPPRGGYGWYLKALHLLLDASAHGELRSEFEFFPKLEDLLTALEGSPLPVMTRLLLMGEYERRGEFSKVSEQFRLALRKSPRNSKLLSFGMAFFERLSGHEDKALIAMGLPRQAILAILEELSTKKTAPTK